MNADPQTPLARFVAALGRSAGLSFSDDKRPLLSSALTSRAQECGLSTEAYCDLIEQGQCAELGAIAELLTVPETYFFRNADHFAALQQHVIADLFKRRPVGHKLRVLSAGCASGEEPYSIAMLLAEMGYAQHCEVTACDLSPAVLAHARRGIYNPWALRDTSPERRARWFRRDGKRYALDAAIMRNVTFIHANLAENVPSIFKPAHYDLILCRNVLMYFTSDAMNDVVARLRNSLSDGGYLFLGHAETLRGTGAHMRLCHTHSTFYYQRVRATEGAASTTPAATDDAAWMTELGALPWYEAIAAASERVRRMSTSAPANATPTHPRRAAAIDVIDVIELIRQERRDDALKALRGGDLNTRSDESLVTEAALLVQAGDVVAAELLCRDVLTRNDGHAVAHYVLALCEELRGELKAAIEHSDVARRLDPAFAMPWMHLGLLFRRSERFSEAQSALTQACQRLADESSARLVLFGGGFDRDALIQLCAAELSRMEVPR